jgi:diguanylate cyclase (GGDEF)-like protein/PAS domain S-box-containing protein
MTRNIVGVISSMDQSVVELLGWRPDEMIGSSSTKFVHPDDQASAVAAWVKMLDSPDGVGLWRGRYQSAFGTWVWVETANTYEDADEPMVRTVMAGVAVEQVSMEERLYARGQLLSRLSDALPVGVFQVSLAGEVTFTNDRLHIILGVGPRSSISEQLSTIVAEDQPIFETALADALADRPVPDVEIRIRPTSDVSAQTPDEERVCLLGLRTLTDSSGVVSGAVGCLSDVTERAQLRRELEVRASTDALTSCLNRAATLELVQRTVTVPSPEFGNAVVFIDLDQFKSVNDSFGHAAGDRLLVEVAERVRSAIREGDQLGRFGGDEFLVVCPRVESAERASDIAERIATAIATTVDLGPAPVRVRVRASVGVAWTTDTLDADTLIAWADSAMYESKRLGGQAVTLFTEPEHGTFSVIT